MADKPEGPIWVDMSGPLLNSCSMAQVVHIANLAMNKLTLRDWGEIFGEVGLHMDMNLIDKKEETP